MGLKTFLTPHNFNFQHKEATIVSNKWQVNQAQILETVFVDN